MSFDLPAALGLALLLPVYFLLRGQERRSVPIPGSAVLQAARLRGLLPELLRAACLAGLVLAMAGPSTAGAVVETRSEGVPIVLAVDVSSSMLAQDFGGRDRLEVARSALRTFVESRRDPIAVVAFAAEALTLVPTTTHRPVLLGAIGNLRVGLLVDGTAIGDGLATAVNRLRRGSGNAGVVVLMSDGESNRGTIDPREAASAAAAFGVQVFTVGIGSEGVARVPVRAPGDAIRYAEAPVAVDEELLREIATVTGGEYFRAADPAALDAIYAEIDRRVPRVVESTRFVERRSWTGTLLVLAGALLALEWLVRGSRWGAVP